jgi:hypothetical protein
VVDTGKPENLWWTVTPPSARAEVLRPLRPLPGHDAPM